MAYLPIEDHALIGDLHTVALVGKDGSIGWLCLPRFDSPSVFAAILDDQRGGSFRIAPETGDCSTKQFYWPESNVLMTRFLSDAGVGQITDFMPLGQNPEVDVPHQVVRRVQTVRGEMRYRLRCSPAFDYARATPAPAQTTGSELPDIGNPANTALSLEDEYKIGLMIVRQLRESGQIVEDPEINEYLQGLGMRLASQAHEGAHRFTFFAVRDSSINAFALPGGFIGVNAGLVKATRSEAELAGVLAHEIAHVTQRHIARSIQNAGRANLASMAGMLAAILIGATTGLPSDAVLGGVTAAQGLAAQNQINFTRANEAEADRVGMGILSAAGFDPMGMPEFFNVMQQRAGSGGRNIPPMLLSHPVTSERIAETRDRASKMERPRTPDSTGYALIRDRLELETLSPETQARDLFTTAKSADYPSTDDEQYGRALVLIRTGAAGEAIPMLQSLRDRRPDVMLYHTALGQAQLAAGLVDESRATLEDAMRLFPRNVPVTMRYAETLMRAGEPKLAHTVLLDLFNNVPPTAEQVRYTAIAANAAGDVADSYYYMSEYHIISGDLALAINQLKLAQAVPGINGVQRERFDARIRELQEYLPKGKRSREVAEPEGADPERRDDG